LWVDDLDVVPVGVEHERAVVARVVDRPLARRAVVLVARGERGGAEGAHRGVLARGEREVEVLSGRPLVADEREAAVRARQLHAAAQLAQDDAVQAPEGGEIRDGDDDVVEHRAEAPVGNGVPRTSSGVVTPRARRLSSLERCDDGDLAGGTADHER
jgi:hypothetical protein